MFASTMNGICGKVGLTVSAICMAALLACASTKAPAPTAVGPMSLSSVTVEADGEATLVSLNGLTEPVYNAFKQAEPNRVVIDLASVEPGEVASAIAVYDGTIDEVTVTGFHHEGASSTRVELSLAADAEYTVVDLEDRLEIRVSAATPAAAPAADAWAVTEPATDATATEVASETTSEEDPWATPEAEEGAWTPEAETPVPATTLYGVSTATEGDALAVQLEADGAIEGATWFNLDDPQRLVVDVPGITSQVESPVIDVNGSWVSRIRVGQHDEKVRVVLDGAEGAPGFEAVNVVTLGTGLWLGLGDVTSPVAPVAMSPGAEEETDAAEAAPAELAETETAEDVTETADASGDAQAAETGTAGTETAEAWAEEASFDAAEEAAPATQAVYGVQLENDEARERVVIVTEGPVEFVTTHPAPDTTVVSLKGATIDPDAAVRIAPDAPGAVSLVTAFQQPETAEPEVRVVVRGQEGAKPAVSQEGALLFLDFAPAEMASRLPMLSDVAAAESMPASIDPDADAVDILAEGGLVDGKAYTGRRISLDFKDVEIDDVLRLIAEVSDLNIIAGDEVNGKVTIRLVDVPWDQALDVILLTRGLGFVRVGNVLRIAPADLLKTEEEARLQERRAKEKLEDLVVKLQPVNYADVSEIEKMVKRLLTARGSVDVDERTNTVILKDIASVIDEATALIKAIDTQTPQVMIEAKIVEANLDFSKELGATWAFGVQPLTDGFDESSPDRRDERLGLGNDVLFHDNPLFLGDITDTFNHVAVVNPITSVPNGLLDLGAFILDERLNIEARIEAAESYGEGKVISSPRIVTLDNRKATIEQGVSIPFQTFENGDAKLEFIDAVLRLDVTPHITADQSIIMKLEVQRNAPDTSVETPTGSPAIAKNEAETETLVKDGQTLVIGGIYVVDQSETESRVPYFHKIPLLGNAFKNNEVRDIRKELLVFVTPRIVINPELGS